MAGRVSALTWAAAAAGAAAAAAGAAAGAAGGAWLGGGTAVGGCAGACPAAWGSSVGACAGALSEGPGGSADGNSCKQKGVLVRKGTQELWFKHQLFPEVPVCHINHLEKFSAKGIPGLQDINADPKLVFRGLKCPYVQGPILSWHLQVLLTRKPRHQHSCGSWTKITLCGKAACTQIYPAGMRAPSQSPSSLESECYLYFEVAMPSEQSSPALTCSSFQRTNPSKAVR